MIENLFQRYIKYELSKKKNHKAKGKIYPAIRIENTKMEEKNERLSDGRIDLTHGRHESWFYF